MEHRGRKSFLFITAALTLFLTSQPARVQASGFENLCRSVGVAAFLDVDLTREEYVAIADAAQGAYWGYTNLGIADTQGAYLNVREEPSVSAKIVGKMEDDSACEILEVEDGWAKIESGAVNGYVCYDFLLTGPDAIAVAKEAARTVAVSKGDGVNVRTEPDAGSEVIAQLAREEELEYVDDAGNWIRVRLDQRDAYVAAEYVEITTKLDTALTMGQVLYGKEVSELRVDVVEFAKQFIGNPYVWGGISLTKGADCSGFVQSVFKNFGIKLNRNSRAQAQNGTEVRVEDLLPGDLIFYSKDGTINHVALYIGNGQVIHASSPETGIKISEYDYRTPTKCRRVISD